ncbi:helix-turn-helix transcriptional regulator [Herbaspirillum sp. C7C2]|uniref:helix-turn-helix domain-containing protein n=1 Tax=Herbaspirillum sp. C7C2 TaxID=2736666 RepID=UPI001F52B37F|nr:helix-turn-helix transcriptional regulator [Herbaspirillum sp. C7C2]MCI1016249.1 helix-turn-helix transcriptional regulator [Herbaspirillum sp. C7C2]
MEKDKYRYIEKVFLQLLREEREAAGVKQSDLATALGHYQGYVSKVETGERRITAVGLLVWCEELGINVDDFMKKVREALEGVSDVGVRKELKNDEGK